jgi:hypothetical protein
VWVEVNLLHAQAYAEKNECAPAVRTVEQLASPVPGIAFTQDGMETFANSARANYVRGEVYAACGKPENASKNFDAASGATGTSEVIWAWAAAKKRSGFDAAQWQTRLLSAASSAKANAERSSYPSLWLYNAGALWIAAGKMEAGQKELREALLEPEAQLSHHFARLVLEGSASQ